MPPTTENKERDAAHHQRAHDKLTIVTQYPAVLVSVPTVATVTAYTMVLYYL